MNQAQQILADALAGKEIERETVRGHLDGFDTFTDGSAAEVHIYSGSRTERKETTFLLAMSMEMLRSVVVEFASVLSHADDNEHAQLGSLLSSVIEQYGELEHGADE